MIYLRYNLRMHLKIFAILVIFHVNYSTAICFWKLVKSSTHRDYANKIGMLCVNKFEPEESSNQKNGSFFIEVGKNDDITESLKVLGTERKIIFFISGFDEDFKPEAEDDTMLERSIKSLKGWCLDKETVVCGFDYMHAASAGQNMVDYYRAASGRVPFAAGIIANIMEQMYHLKVIKSFENIELIGFSLGSHVAGLVGRNIQKKLKKVLPRIIALDPPHTFTFGNEKMLQMTDAKYIQAIYSSRLSSKKIKAHCKIILNDGITQPLCYFMNPIDKAFCGHEYLFYLYNNFIATGCNNLSAEKDKNSNVNDENVPESIKIGHLNPESISGVFKIETAEIHNVNENINYWMNRGDKNPLLRLYQKLSEMSKTKQ